MTAGRGIVHSEMPGDKDVAHGLQLWINLPASEKMCEPRYQELVAKDIPKVDNGDVKAAIIAGEAFGVKAAIFTKTPVHYIHFTLAPNAVLDHPVPPHWNSFLYTLRGTGFVGDEAVEKNGVEAHYSIILDHAEDANGVRVTAGPQGFEFVIVAGEPINEPVVQYGPFVMNTAAEINDAFRDYRSGRNGFEGAHDYE